MESKIYHYPSKSYPRCHQSSPGSFKSKNKKSSESGFSYFELILWTSALVSLFIAFISLSRYTEKKHEQIITEFVREWNSIN